MRFIDALCDSLGMTEEKWEALEPEKVRVEWLIPTDESHEWMGGSSSPVTKDECIHVVAWQGEKFIEDGHHRFHKARKSGVEWIWARVLRVPD